MAGKVFFSVSMSLDGFSAPESMEGLLGTGASVMGKRMFDLGEKAWPLTYAVHPR